MVVSDHKPLELKALEEAVREGICLEGYDLSSVIWDGLELLDLKLKDCTAVGVEIRGCDLDGLDAENCDFTGASIASTTLKGATFKKCKFTDREKHEGASFRYVKLDNSSFLDCDASFSTFDRCELFDLKLKDSHFRAVDFASSEFGRRLSKTRSLVRFEALESNLESSNFFGLDLETIKLEKCSLRLANFAESNLSSALLLDCNLNEAEWRGADLSGANLGGSTVEGLDLRELKSHEGLMVGTAQGAVLLGEMGIGVF